MDFNMASNFGELETSFYKKELLSLQDSCQNAMPIMLQTNPDKKKQQNLFTYFKSSSFQTNDDVILKSLDNKKPGLM